MSTMYDTETRSRHPISCIPSERRQGARDRFQSAIAAVASGKPVLMCDNAPDPLHGEIVIAAQYADRRNTAFAVRHSSGFLQVALPPDRCKTLGLIAQCGVDDDPTAQQRVTVDAATGITTGISAADRAVTARLLASADASRDSFTRPGHLVPVRVSPHDTDGGIAAAALRLVSESGCAAAAMFAAIVGIDEQSGLPTGQDLLDFARQHQLVVLGIDDCKRSMAMRCSG